MRGKKNKKLEQKKKCKYCVKVIDRYKLGYYMSDKGWKNKEYCNSSCQMKNKNPMFIKEVVEKNKGVFKCGHKVTKEMRKKMKKSWFKNGHKLGWKGRYVTKEEKVMYKFLLPLGFECEIYFGVGKGGLKRYGCKWFLTDFYNKKYNLVIELDGSSHNKYVKERDKRKDLCLKEIHSLNVLRFDIRKKFIPEIILNDIKNHLGRYK